MRMPLILSVTTLLALGTCAITKTKTKTVTATVTKTGKPITTTVSSIVTTTVTTQTPRPTNFSYLDCYHDDGRGGNSRLLGDKFDFSGNITTIEDCATFCDGYTYFGMEYGAECYCGNNFNYGPDSTPYYCNSRCVGTDAEICGGVAALSTFQFDT